MIIPHFTGDLQKRMDTLKGVLRGKSRIRLVGSSFGGLMATIFTLENESMVERLILWPSGAEKDHGSRVALSWKKRFGHSRG
jgi:homoserine acetyltransferase